MTVRWQCGDPGDLQKVEDLESKLKIVPIEIRKHNENDVDEPISDSD